MVSQEPQDPAVLTLRRKTVADVKAFRYNGTFPLSFLFSNEAVGRGSASVGQAVIYVGSERQHTVNLGDWVIRDHQITAGLWVLHDENVRDRYEVPDE